MAWLLVGSKPGYATVDQLARWLRVLADSGCRRGRAGARLRLDSASGKETLAELQAHLEDQVEELEGEGFSQEEAATIAAECFGDVKAVADGLNEAHNSSNWPQAVAAALPHVLFSMLFALHQWSNVGWLLVILLCTAGVTIYGWQHNKPTWLFTWLGYTLIPLLVVGSFLVEYGLSLNSFGSSWWVWLLCGIYFPVILWLFVHIVIQVLKRDWLLGSLMMLPLPAVVGWLMTTQWKEQLLGGGGKGVHGLEPWIALSFLTLGGIVVLFIKLKQRHLKVATLLVSGVAVVVVVTCSSGSFGLLNLIIPTLLILFLLLGPALVEHKLVDQDVESLDCFVESNLHRWSGGG